MILTKRWFPLKPHPEQLRLVRSSARFKVVPSGRRSGKTERAKRYTLRKALKEILEREWDDGRYFLGAPTRDQAKAIFWSDLKKLVPPILMEGSPRETELGISLVNGADICVVGLDKPERIEGRPWNGGILDEYANMKAKTWPEHVRPALSDRRGWCWLIGVPEGRNHYYELYKKALADTTGEWDAFLWPSEDILPPEEIEAARRDLDELTFNQEYRGDFINFHGRAYYPFNEKEHCARLAYDKRLPLIFCFDFNVDPGVSAVCQEQKLPNGLLGTGVIGEVWIPRNSNTPAVCRKLIADWGKHEGRVYCYGDATGGARGSAKVQGSDWDLIKRELSQHFKDRLYFKVPRANPSERSRINAVNSRLKNGAGEVKLMVDPVYAPHVVTDFEGVRLLAGGAGEIDKRSDPMASHLSDSLGYFVVYEHPVVRGTVTSQDMW